MVWYIFSITVVLKCNENQTELNRFRNTGLLRFLNSVIFSAYQNNTLHNIDTGLIVLEGTENGN